ncbi:FtsK/SpoIIIE domain-containing protein [Streptomyces mutabilis]|uniref:FtsK/SpoIIIE domain-containing protein n=1 Tax=Streptomyces mutabilis TaxID=67332 RepID=UPI0036C73336
MATETEPIEQQPEAPAIDETTEPSRKDKMKKAFAVQRANATARGKDWLAGGDLDHVDVIQVATDRKNRKHAEKIANQQRIVAEAHGRLHHAKMQAENGENVSASTLSNLGGRAAQEEAKLAALQATIVMPPTDREINNVRTSKKAGRAAILAGGSLGGLSVLGTAAEQAATGQPMLLAALGTAVGYGWYLVSRPFVAGQHAPAPFIPEQLAASSLSVAGADGREYAVPAPSSLTVDDLEAALKAIGELRGEEKIQILAVPQRDREGNTTVVFDLPPRTKVANLVKKIEEFAGALGRDSSMVDISKAGTELRTSLWLTDRDPFEDTRPSPLLKAPRQLDAFTVGVPVGWNKRGTTINLVINNSSFVIAGMTRSGKGVGASNLIVGAAFDPRINLRIVAGKNNGEWDPYAKTGAASTYFKPSPERFLALLKALLSDKDRRERILGELGKSKLTASVIEQLGGIELVVVDEVATYTRPGRPLRDEILEALIELSAVAAGAGILLVLITQYPEVDVLPQALAMNCGTKWAMRVDNADQSNAVLGKGSSGAGRDASKFDPPRQGLGWLVNPFAGVTDKARSFDLDEDERGEITMLLEKAAKIREKAGRLAGQWEDPIEQHLLNATGLSSAAGGPKRDGTPGRMVMQLTPEQRQQADACSGCLIAMNDLGRDAAQLDEMAELIGGGMDEERLGELLRAAGAGGTVKITVPHKTGRVNGYRRAPIADALAFLEGN